MPGGKYDSFRSVLEKAISGSQDALEEIFRLYEPMLRKYSTLDGQIDEDLRQYIMIYIAKYISKFVI